MKDVTLIDFGKLTEELCDELTELQDNQESLRDLYAAKALRLGYEYGYFDAFHGHGYINPGVQLQVDLVEHDEFLKSVAG